MPGDPRSMHPSRRPPGGLFLPCEVRALAACGLIAIGILILAVVSLTGCASKRASVPSIVEPNTLNGSSRPSPVIR